MNTNRGRGWYCQDGKLLWCSGEPYLMSEDMEEAWYYFEGTKGIDWDAKHISWGDTYDIEADERAEKRKTETEREQELDDWQRYFNVARRQWN